MRNWLGRHRHALRWAWRQLASQAFGALLAALVIGITLALPATGLVLLEQAEEATRGASGKPEISVFLQVDASQAQVDDVSARLRALPGLANWRHVPRDAALQQMRDAGLADVLASLQSNPLPDAFVIEPRSGDPAVFEQLRATFSSWPGVAQVQLDSAWVKRLAALLRLAETGLWLLAGLLSAALVIITFNTLRLNILNRRHEIGVSRLLGATDAFIRRPFLWFGTLQGLAGGLAGWALVAGVIAVLQEPVASLAQSYGANFALHAPAPADIGALLGAACLLGWLGALIAIQRHLHTPEVDA
ncbi:MAG: ABC transporter permease [Zoogloea sp.]|nr:ABC transporter permease [Zoogloea sp.]